jgi:hypothetical protein
MPRDERIVALRRQLAGAIAGAVDEMISPDFGIPQPRMSELNRGIVGRMSLEWLILRVFRMGGRVTIAVELPDVRGAWWSARFRAAAARRVARGEGTVRDERLVGRSL